MFSAILNRTKGADHYHNLSDVIVFIHSSQKSWHNNDLFDPDLARMVRLLSDKNVLRSGFFNPRCHPERGCPDHIHPYMDILALDQDEQVYLARCGTIFTTQGSLCPKF